MEYTAKQIAAVIGGEIIGNPEVVINRLSKIEEGTSGSLSFLANAKYRQFIHTTGASIVIISGDLMPETDVAATLIKVKDAYTAFAGLLDMYNKQQARSGISSLAFFAGGSRETEAAYIGEFAWIGENTTIGKGSQIYPHTYVGDNCVIGENTTIYQGVKIYNDITIGNNCVIHAGVVIGADGFGFAQQADNYYRKVAQIGNVVIEDDVEIGANTTIDRATMGSTVIRRGARLDNLIQIAHNVEIGENTVIVAQVGIAGSTRIGRNCIIAGQAGITGHLNIADNVKIGAQSGIASSLTKEGDIVLGSPAFDVVKYRKAYIHFRNLEKHVARIDELESKLKRLTGEGDRP